MHPARGPLRGVRSTELHTANEFYSGYPWQDAPRASVPGEAQRPAFGSVVSRVRGADAAIPPYVSLGNRSDWERAYYLGLQHEPFRLGGDSSREPLENMSRRRDRNPQRLQDQRQLLRTFDTLRRDLDGRGTMAGMDAFQERALRMITSSRVRDAFDLDREPAAVRARYGDGPIRVINQECNVVRYHEIAHPGRALLQARRLVEAGVSVVTCSLPDWDTHRYNFTTLRQLLPPLDQALTALVLDLEARGLLDEVAMVMGGELGRRPRIGDVTPDGRTHWPEAGFLWLAGGGLRRRVTMDLIGLPPTVQEQHDFLADTSPDAYPKVVDRLLASPHFGERWAQHWLDLVRYAESDGFKADELRPQAHRYRDYVIRAFSHDLPFDRFVQQQLAGDELEPDNPDALVATGFNRLWPDEYNAANLEQRRQEILDDMTDVTGQVFLGLTVGCARCHDHKYDPITQIDYFRLQAFFAPIQPRDDLPAVSRAALADYQHRQASWQAATRDIQAEMEALIASRQKKLRAGALEKFRPEIQKAVLTPREERSPYQQLIAAMAEKQMDLAARTAPAQIPPADRKRYQELERRLAAHPASRPEPLAPAMMVHDVGTVSPPTYRLQGGDWRKPAEAVEPGFPLFLGNAPVDTRLSTPMASTGRRAALARWLTRKDNPLTARVIVNRLWQHHFGQGIIGTPGDFGLMGDPPTHPELLDWLAIELMENGWRLKHLHRLMVLSAAYCQSATVDPDNPVHRRALTVDRGNHLLWHARRRRLEGEALRDAMLAVSGALSRRAFGPSARPALPPGISTYAWKPDPLPQDRNRRSLYVLARRNQRYPLFDVFDLPDMHNSCSRRLTTTTAPQALLLLNGDLPRECAQQMAARLAAEEGSETALVARACQLSWCRPPTDAEMQDALQMLHAQADLLQQSRQGQRRARPAAWQAALEDLCLALLESNEFLYVD